MTTTTTTLPRLLIAQTMQSREDVLLCERCGRSAAPLADQIALCTKVAKRRDLKRRDTRCQTTGVPPSVKRLAPWDASPCHIRWCARGCSASYCSEACELADADEHLLLCEGDAKGKGTLSRLDTMRSYMSRSQSTTNKPGAKLNQSGCGRSASAAPAAVALTNLSTASSSGGVASLHSEKLSSLDNPMRAARLHHMKKTASIAQVDAV